MLKIINWLALIVVWFWGIVFGCTALFPAHPLFGIVRGTFNWSHTQWLAYSQRPGLRLFFGLCSILLFGFSIVLYKLFKKEEKQHFFTIFSRFLFAKGQNGATVIAMGY